MARFEVFRNSGSHADDIPYLLDVQSDLLHGLDTRIVIPLRRCDRFPVSRIPQRLTPVFNIEGIACMLETPTQKLLSSIKPPLSIADFRAKHASP